MTFTLEDAIILATNAHRGQLDKVGEAYILHPLRVMFSFPSYKHRQRMIAVLHDVLEDTTITAEDLLREGCDPLVVEAIVALTYSVGMQQSGITYNEFIKVVAKNRLAREVKRADIEDNTSMERLIRLDRPTQDRLLNKYNAALSILDTKEYLDDSSY